jgi:hypothetical protein
MSNPAVDLDGDLITVGLQATIHGAVTVVTGSGVLAAVTVVTTLGDTITCQAGDLSSPDDQQISANPGRTSGGNAFALFDPVTVNGVVTAVTNGPWGTTGQVTIKTDFSGTSVTVASGTLNTNG